MPWSSFLYVLSILSLTLGIYMTFIGSRSIKIYWKFLIVSVDVAIWFVGIALVMENRSLLMTGFGITMAEVVINAVFPIITCYMADLVPKKQYIRRILGLQIAASVLIILFTLFQGYRQAEYINGTINLVLIKNSSFYLALLFCIVSPLLTIFTINREFIRSEYKRDRRQGMLWAAIFSSSIVWFVIRFYFPATYKYGCLMVFFSLIMIYFNIRYYHPEITLTANLADYIYSMAKIPLLVLGRDGTIFLANDGALSFFEKPRQTLIGMNIAEIVDFGDKALSFSRTAPEGNRINRIEGRALNNDAVCEIDITHIYDKYEEFHCAILFISDITDRIKLIKEMEEAKLKAELANRTKSVFLARMSHEIRTPLNAILGLSEVELQNSLSGRTHANLEKIYGSGSHLLEIVNDVLDISKIESGNFEILPALYEVYQLISDTVHLNLPRIGSKPIKFSLDIAEDIPSTLFGDELRLRQILTNLLSNAFKYTEKGEVWLRISWERKENTALICFTVEDTGRGIRQADLEKLFSEYTQLDAAANRKIEGTGLGLSIARGLADMMGGSITVESEYGAGSVFRLVLPQKIIDEKPIGAQRVKELRDFRFHENYSRSKGNNIVRSWMPYGKVLVVDDLQTNLDVMTGLLMPYGLKVDTVLSGREAVERTRAEEVRYDLIFMDHMMPEMDGIEAVRLIRNEIGGDYAQKVPIVVLTANAIAGNREMFLESGFNDFIAKPIDIKQLDLVLNQWVRDIQSEETLKEAESQARKREESRKGDGQEKEAADGIDAEGRWLLEHPVEGIDFNAALTLYGNSGAAYIQILKSFVTHTPSLLEKMDIHMESSPPDYTVEAHGLKGTCGVICANETADLARELELASKEGKIDLVGRKHGELRRMALELTERLKALLEEWEAGLSPEAKERRREPDKALLARLSAAAGQFNSNVTEEILEELERYRYEKGEELILWLREQAENFDYDAIHRRLEVFLNV